jgi:ribulose 1,5-bisphosphate carboxylase large subunit-like protein
MSKISDKDLQIKYAKYTKRVKEIMKDEKETSARAIAKTALEFNVTAKTVENAINNRQRKRKQS